MLLYKEEDVTSTTKNEHSFSLSLSLSLSIYNFPAKNTVQGRIEK